VESWDFYERTENAVFTDVSDPKEKCEKMLKNYDFVRIYRVFVYFVTHKGGVLRTRNTTISLKKRDFYDPTTWGLEVP